MSFASLRLSSDSVWKTKLVELVEPRQLGRIHTRQPAELYVSANILSIAHAVQALLIRHHLFNGVHGIGWGIFMAADT